MGLRILHIAPYSFAGVPMTMVKAERSLGYDSRLVTLFKDPQDREEDICLDLPLMDSWPVRTAKRLFTPHARRTVRSVARVPEKIPVEWIPTQMEGLLFRWRERVWTSRIERAVSTYKLDGFDIVQLDGGLEFFRDGRTVKRWKSQGKRVICCYTGSDLRTRGVIPVIDDLSDVNVTVEFDHLRFHPNIHYVGFPLEVDHLGEKQDGGEETLVIGHAPTYRQAKGSDVIIPIVQELEKTYPVKLVLIEGLPYPEALVRKRNCDIFIDQIGNLGYGMNGIEALAMGIPTCSCLAPGFEDDFPDHPFFVIDAGNLKEVLLELIENERLRNSKCQDGKKWVRRIHDPISVVRKIHNFADI